MLPKYTKLISRGVEGCAFTHVNIGRSKVNVHTVEHELRIWSMARENVSL